MVLRILEEGLPLDEVIFFDTGMEFDSIYHNRDKMKRLLAERKILFTELSSKNHFLFDMFVRPVKYRNLKTNRIQFIMGMSGVVAEGFAGEQAVNWQLSSIIIKNTIQISR